MRHPYGTAITVRRGSPGGFDPYGDPVPGSTTDTVIDGCAIAPRMSNEPTERGRQGIIVGLTVYAPAGSDILATDLILIGGVVYAVDGVPGVWVNPFNGAAPGVEFAVTMATG
jgi:hypothetical protein